MLLLRNCCYCVAWYYRLIAVLHKTHSLGMSEDCESLNRHIKYGALTGKQVESEGHFTSEYVRSGHAVDAQYDLRIRRGGEKKNGAYFHHTKELSRELDITSNFERRCWKIICKQSSRAQLTDVHGLKLTVC